MANQRDTKQGKTAEKPRAREREIEIAYYTKELGRPLQRKMLQGRLDDLCHSGLPTASHGEDTDAPGVTPMEDRAG